LRGAFPTAEIEETSDAEELIKRSLSKTWDIVVCDLVMPGSGGLDVVKYMKQHFPKTPVLILSMYPEEQYAIRALRTGAAGYLSKDAAPEELAKAIQRILLGRKYISQTIMEKLAGELDPDSEPKPPHESLSVRELTIFQLLASGKTVGLIAEQLCIGSSTVSTYRAKVLSKLNLKSNAELARYALENKLI